MPSAVQGFPITYAVKGKQYLVVPVGSGDGGALNTGARLTGKPLPPATNAIFVFALPDRVAPKS
jgi:hypothetical protein